MGGRKKAGELLVGIAVLRYSKIRMENGKWGAVMWLLKLPFKLVAIVLMLAVGTIGVLLKIVSGISHVALGLIMFLLFVGGVITAFQGNWPLVGVIFVMEVICFAASLAAAILVEVVDGIFGALLEFIYA